MKISKEINNALIIATRLTTANNGAKLVAAELKSLMPSIPADIMSDEEREALYAALTILEKIKGRTDFQAIKDLIEGLDA